LNDTLFEILLIIGISHYFLVSEFGMGNKRH